MDGLFRYRALRRANRESQFDRKRRYQRKAFVEALEKRQLLTVTAASINPLTSAVEGAATSFALSATSDDSTITGFQIAWGDGCFDSLGGDATSASHTCNNAGSYSVTATASDGDPSSLDGGTNVSVADQPISAVGVSNSTNAGASWSGTVAAISDPNSSEGGGNLSAMIYWSDGVNDSGGISRSIDGTFSVTDSRTFSTPGGVSASISISDAGGSSASASSDMSVYGISSISVDDGVSVGVGQTSYVNVNVAGNFASEDSVGLSAAGSGNANLGPASSIYWNNDGGGTFTFPVTGTSPGALTLSASESAFGQSASSSDNAVLGLSGISVDHNVSLGASQSSSVNVVVQGAFSGQDSVTLSSSGPGAVTCGMATPISWNDIGGGTFSVPITAGATPGAFTLTASESQFGGTDSSSDNVVTGLSSITVDGGLSIGEGQSGTVNVTVSGVFPSQDSVNLSASPGSLYIGSPTYTWNNDGGGTFSFPVTAENPGDFTLTATDSLYNASDATSNNVVIGSVVSSFTVDDNVYVTRGGTGNVNVYLSGTFFQQDGVTLTADSSNVSIDIPSVTWNNNGGGVYSFPITGNTLGPVAFHADETSAALGADSTHNGVTGVTSMSIDSNVSVPDGGSGTVNVYIAGYFSAEDDVTFGQQSGYNVAIGSPSVSWTPNGGTFSFPITGQSIGAFTFSASEPQFGNTASANAAVTGVTGISISDVHPLAGGTATAYVHISGAFSAQDSVDLSASGNAQIWSGWCIDWDNAAGGDFQFTVYGAQPGPFSLHAVDSQYGSTSDNPNCSVLGLSGISVDGGTSLDIGQTQNVQVYLSGVFASQDPVTLSADSGNVSIGNASIVQWDNTTGGIISFPVTGMIAGPVTFTAHEDSFGQSAAGSATVLPMPLVTDLSTTGVSTNEIDLSWTTTDAAYATGIQVERAADGGDYAPLGDPLPPDATQYQDVGLTLGAHYSYRVYATDSSGAADSQDLDTWTLEDGPVAGLSLTAGADGSFDGIVADFPAGAGFDVSSAIIDWGDGGTTSGVVTPDGNGGYNVSGSHVYDTALVYDTSVTVYDDAGNIEEALGDMTVPDGAPAVVIGATGTVSSDGTTADLSVLGGDNAGEEDLTYTWSSTGPGDVTFDGNGSNDAQETVATFTAIGNYNFIVTIENSDGESVTSSCSVTVDQVGTDINVTPDSPTVSADQSQQLTAMETDQFGNDMATQPTFKWQLVPWPGRSEGPGIISDSGLYTAPDEAYGAADIEVFSTVSNDNAAGGTTITLTTPVTVSVGVVPPNLGVGFTAPDLPLALDFTAPGDATVCLEAKLANGGGNFQMLTQYQCTGGLAQYTGGISQLTGGISQFVVWPLAFPCTDYIYRVRAMAPDGTLTYASTSQASGSSSPDESSPPAPSGVMTAIAFRYDNGDGTGDKVGMHVIWNNGSDNESSFTILRSDNGADGPYTAIGSVGADVTSFDDQQLPPPGTTYSYKIEASNAAGSTVSGGFVETPPGKPASVTAGAGVDIGGIPCVVLNWVATWLDTGFYVQWSSDGTDFKTIDEVPWSSLLAYTYGDTSPFPEGPQDSDGKNYYRIIAYDEYPGGARLESVPSDVVSDQVILPTVAVQDTNGGVDGPAPYTCQDGQTLNVSADKGLLANDFDPAGLTFQVTDYGTAEDGSVTVNPDGSFSYTPDGAFAGIDSFWYGVTNSAGKVSGGTVDISVVNPPPIAGNAAYSVNRGDTLSVSAATGLGANVLDPSEGTLTFSVAPNGMPRHGSLTLNADGTFVYTPNSTFKGWDNFLYIANDGYNDSNIGDVIFTTPGAHYHIPNAGAAHPLMFDNNLAGLQATYDATNQRLGAVMSAFAAFGQSIKTGSTATDANSKAAMEASFAKLEQLQAAYNTYLLQLSVATRAAADVLSNRLFLIHNGAVFDLIAMIAKLPWAAGGLSPDGQQTFSLQQASNYLFSSERVFLNKVNWSIQTANDIHAAAETALAVGGAAALAEAGIEIATEQGCAAFFEYSAKTIVNLAAAQVINGLMQDALKLAEQYGVSKEYVQIGADALQVTSLLLAARNQARAREANCFTGDTLVDTINQGAEAIDEIHLGERVGTAVNEGSDPGAPQAATDTPTAVDPPTWREVDLTMPDSQNPADNYTMQLLEPLSWTTANNAVIGGWVELSLPELQISGIAQVQNITSCPTIETGGGHVVLGTFQHISNDILDITLTGEDQPLKVTSGHKFWSLDRGTWVEAGRLCEGERLAGENGPFAIEAITRDSVAQEVYNLDVEGDHRYLVTSLGILVHNACSSTSGENAAAGIGRAEHNRFYETMRKDGFTANEALENGELPDAYRILYDSNNKPIGAIVAELKPNNAKALRRGLIQLDRYARQIARQFGIPLDSVQRTIKAY